MSTKSRLPLLIGTLLILGALILSALPGQVAQAQTAARTFTPTADSYVYSDYPNSNYGTYTFVRLDNSPIRRTYLRFVVSGLNGAAVQSAKLRMYATSSNSAGYTVDALSNNTWTETGLTYANAPAPGSAIKTSAAVTSGQWIEADVSSYVQAEGTYNMVLTINSTTNTVLASREAGATAPQLVITTGAASATPAPTAAPTSASLTRVSFKKGPELIYTGSDSAMKIFWQHTTNTTFRLDWGTTTAYGSSKTITAYDTTNHLYSYTITGLIPDLKYYYRVVLGSQYSPGTFYTSADPASTTLKFVSYGDDRSNPSAHNAVAGQVVKLYQSDPGYQTINLVVGDLVSSGDLESAWTTELYDPTLTNIRAELANIADLPVLGNHEESGVLMERYFPVPYVANGYWSFDYGPAHFVMLNQYVSITSGSAQYNWLKNDLAATTKKWKIVVLHMPGWSANGGHANNTTVQTVLEPIFEQYKVAMVLAGHNHYYARASVNGVQHLTLGTGGAPLYTPATGQPKIVKTYKGYGYAKFAISGSTLTGTFLSSSGSTIDTFTVTR